MPGSPNPNDFPSYDVHPDIELGTLVRGRIAGWDDPESDASYVYAHEFIGGPLWKQEVPELGYWQYGVIKPGSLDGTGGVVMIEPYTLQVIKERGDGDSPFEGVAKFNPNHDPHSGKFSSHGGVAGKLPTKTVDKAGWKMDDHIDDIEDEEAVDTALDRWQDDAVSGMVNRHLRRQKQPEEYADIDTGAMEEMIINPIREAMFPSEVDTVGYRGIALCRQLKVGDRIKDRGFVAVTPDKDAAHEFALGRAGQGGRFGAKMTRSTTKGRTPYLLQMVIPKGTKGVEVQPDFESIMEDGTYRVTSLEDGVVTVVRE